MANHDWGVARGTALRRSSRDGRTARCIRPGCDAPARDMEVNHITPRAGRGYALGCHHHQDGLEVLCHRHHVEVTTAQRRGLTVEQLRERGRAPADKRLI